MGGEKAIVQFLLEEGADFTTQKGTSTALQRAVTHGNEIVLRLTLKAGADYNHQGKMPFRPWKEMRASHEVKPPQLRTEIKRDNYRGGNRKRWERNHIQTARQKCIYYSSTSMAGDGRSNEVSRW